MQGGRLFSEHREILLCCMDRRADQKCDREWRSVCCVGTDVLGGPPCRNVTKSPSAHGANGLFVGGACLIKIEPLTILRHSVRELCA